LTTIVASVSHGCIAADRRMTCEGPIAHVAKIHRTSDGNLYAMAGDCMMALAFLQKWWGAPNRSYERLMKMISEDARSDFSLLELSPAGLAIIDGWGVRLPLLDQVYGIGTGAPIAVSHVRKGMHPGEAILEAPSLDEFSGVHADFPPQIEYLDLPAVLQPRKRTRKCRPPKLQP